MSREGIIAMGFLCSGSLSTGTQLELTCCCTIKLFSFINLTSETLLQETWGRPQRRNQPVCEQGVKKGTHRLTGAGPHKRPLVPAVKSLRWYLCDFLNGVKMLSISILWNSLICIFKNCLLCSKLAEQIRCQVLNAYLYKIKIVSWFCWLVCNNHSAGVQTGAIRTCPTEAKTETLLSQISPTAEPRQGTAWLHALFKSCWLLGKVMYLMQLS